MHKHYFLIKISDNYIKWFGQSVCHLTIGGIVSTYMWNTTATKLVNYIYICKNIIFFLEIICYGIIRTLSK